MRRRHFEVLRPVCPVCRTSSGQEHPLQLAAVARAEGEVVIEGMLHCPNRDCRREYPILDGVPLLVPAIRAYVSDQLLALLARDDLSADSESLIGDCCGPGSPLDQLRQLLSCYVRDHYGDLDPQESAAEPRPGSALRTLEAGLDLLGPLPGGPVLDLGCAVGRTSLALAQRGDGLVLGVDLNFAMLRLAAGVLHRGTVRYPRRRVGLAFDRREFPAHFAASERVDFWACDVQALPFAAGSFGLAVGLNVLDCVPSPHGLLTETARVLARDGAAVLTTPYDWSPTATPVEAWLGGHSQRAEGGGAAEPVLRALLTRSAHPQSVPGLQLVAEADALPWHVRLHERSTVNYRVHLVLARRSGE
jgi:SAM-dependent methyltransferase